MGITNGGLGLGIHCAQQGETGGTGTGGVTEDHAALLKPLVFGELVGQIEGEEQRHTNHDHGVDQDGQPVGGQELQIQSIVICFFDKILFYDYITDEQSCLFLGADEMLNETELDQMDQHEFTVGQWQYTCKKGFHGYTELVRTNDALSEILVTLPGSGFSAWNTLVPALALFLCLLLLRKYNRHRKEN